jgi:toxin ParE1/3/4
MAAARGDMRSIVAWTHEQFGERPARVYGETLASPVHALAFGPAAMGVKKRTDLAEGLFTLHVSRAGAKGRHFLLFRIAPDEGCRAIEVLRIFHDAMDLPNHASRVSRR